MTLLITATVAGAVLVVLVLVLALVSLGIRTEERRSRGIPGQPPDPLAAAARHIAGLHVRRDAPHAVYPEPTASAARDEGR